MFEEAKDVDGRVEWEVQTYRLKVLPEFVLRFVQSHR